MNNFSLLDDINNISLEPRLQEYLEKKKFYETNNVKLDRSLENEYSITKTDMDIIRKYMNGEKNLYDERTMTNMLDLVEVKKGFVSDKLKNDPRFDRMQKKLDRQNEANRQRNNYSNYNNNIFKFDYQTENNNLNKEEDEEDSFKQSTFLDSKFIETDNKYRILNNEMYKKGIKPNYLNKAITPKMQMKNYVPYGENLDKLSVNHNHNTMKIIGELDSYVDKTNTIYQGNEYDKRNTRVNTTNKCYINTSSYQPIPYMGTKEGLKDINIETDIKCSYPTRGAKSYGYKNPSEHYFDYINDDFQKAEHTVLPFMRGGISSRDDNHKHIKEKHYKREFY